MDCGQETGKASTITGAKEKGGREGHGMTWTERLLFTAVYRHAVSAILSDEKKNADCKAYARGTLEKVAGQVTAYMEDGVIFWLPMRVLFKKCSMIEQAETKKALSEIAKPSLPKGSCGRFREGPYHVPEEELLLWSRASLEAPLNAYGYQRYMELFARFFPEQAKEIFGIASET